MEERRKGDVEIVMEMEMKISEKRDQLNISVCKEFKTWAATKNTLTSKTTPRKYSCEYTSAYLHVLM